jgi:hypothetical protein
MLNVAQVFDQAENEKVDCHENDRAELESFIRDMHFTPVFPTFREIFHLLPRNRPPAETFRKPPWYRGFPPGAKRLSLTRTGVTAKPKILFRRRYHQNPYSVPVYISAATH